MKPTQVWIEEYEEQVKNKNCMHTDLGHEPADPSVGIFGSATWCEDCGEEMNDQNEYYRYLVDQCKTELQDGSGWEPHPGWSFLGAAVDIACKYSNQSTDF